MTDDEPDNWAAIYLYGSEEEARAAVEANAPAAGAQAAVAAPWGVYLDPEVKACQDSDKVLLARAATNLADQLEEWHGGPDEMYRESNRLRQLAALLLPEDQAPIVRE